MQRQDYILLTLAAITVFALLCGCTKAEAPSASSVPQSASSTQSEAPPLLSKESHAPSDTLETADGEFVITFDYEKQSGHASNQFAVWIEDVNGNFVRTLYATRFTADGGYKIRPDSIPEWTVKSGLVSMSKSEIDAITGATPKDGALSYTWDLTDKEGNAVLSGEYRFFVEGNLRWKNRVLYSGVVEVGDVPATAQTDVQFFFEGDDHQPALSEAAPEAAMISDVTASFSPQGNR